MSRPSLEPPNLPRQALALYDLQACPIPQPVAAFGNVVRLSITARMAPIRFRSATQRCQWFMHGQFVDTRKNFANSYLRQAAAAPQSCRERTFRDVPILGPSFHHLSPVKWS
jgi:hypothetical protein